MLCGCRLQQPVSSAAARSVEPEIVSKISRKQDVEDCTPKEARFEEEVVETWYTPGANAKRRSNFQELIKEIQAAERRGECVCIPGDPLCGCL